MLAQNKRLVIILSVIISVLLIPLIAMQFTEEVKWGLFDFIVIGTLLLITGFIFELIMRKIKSIQTRTVLIIVVLILLALTWIELAVGVFGTPVAGS